MNTGSDIMSVQNKDNSSKSRILKSATELFYEKGYNDTSLDDISKSANVNKAMIAYYFKNKSQLAYEVCNNINTDIKKALAKQLTKIDLEVVDNIIMTAVEYKIFASFRKRNPKYRRFIKELCKDNVLLLSQVNTGFGKDIYHDLNKKHNLNFDEIEMKINHYSLTSSLCGLILMHDLGFIDCGHDYLSDKECTIMFRTFGLDQANIDNILEDSKKIANNMEIEISNNFKVI
ncbi:TetR family transcriptional regulator [Alkalibaculum sp. M08DMB]|uniref:TetR family transcriptional regulator n=1 Tax=Alkalibaculum sporogenes TaxID=2655001 RepID=A0A6A7K7H0_9FIRM|nr:TetR/AcrR family transcriptional regulator [Alkalibaculum sporogenes]MPW25449.1 TetR family transcriptional regulator [Alkalibaculum sporogenes]